MSHRIAWLVAIWTCLVLAAATMLLCAAPGGGHSSVLQRPPLSYIAPVLTVPIVMSHPADLRAYALPVGLAGLLLLIVAAPRLFTSRPPHGPAPDGSGRIRIACAPEWLGAAVLVIALASAFVNGTWELSRGWLFHLAVALGWAFMVARLASRSAVRRILTGVCLIAVIATVLSLLHRQIMGIRSVRWPVGPITITAALGAIWTTAAVAMLSRHVWRQSTTTRRRPPDRRTLLTGMALLLAVALVYVSGRRAGWLGLAGAVVLIAVLGVVRRYRQRSVRIAVVAAVMGLLSLAFIWAWEQARDPRREIGGSVALRLTRWTHTVERLADRPLLGFGPDQYVCEMTTVMAPLKAETPQVLHGEIVLAAHNEWLQAAFELGVPGGVLYLAIPIAAILLAARTWFRDPSLERRTQAAAIAAALAAIVIMESVSINLRNPILPAWYWTLIGLAGAVSRPPRSGPWRLPNWAPRTAVVRFAVGALAAALLLTTCDDLQLGIAHSRAARMIGRDDQEAAGLLQLAGSRFGAASWLSVEYDLARAESNVTRTMQTPPPSSDRAIPAERAVAAWRRLLGRCRGYPGAGGQLAAALVDAGRAKEARVELESWLREIDPYDAQTNLLYAREFEEDPVARIERLEHALRDGPMTASALQLASAILAANSPPWWSDRVAGATRDLAERREPDWQNPLAPEVLRLEAALRCQDESLTDAARMQTLAAEAYRALFASNNDHRRPADAETDAWLRAADYVFQADPGDFDRAYRCICEAERFAVLGLDHEDLRAADPAGEFVGGQVIPLELPERLRSLWRLSAKLHLAAGHEDNLALRVLSSLPEPRRTADGVQTRIAELAEELTDAFARLPPQRRPQNYNRILYLAGRSAKSQPAPAARSPADRG
ncbi:MAG: O-antigen ligase family protein [Phycisphaerae bacterium]